MIYYTNVILGQTPGRAGLRAGAGVAGPPPRAPREAGGEVGRRGRGPAQPPRLLRRRLAAGGRQQQLV